MIRTALIDGNNINLDKDFSKYIESTSTPGIIKGLEVQSSGITPGYAWIQVERSNGETFYVLVENTETLAIDTSGNKKVWIEIKQDNIDNGEINEETGENIAEIKTGSSYPTKNFLKLASVEDGDITDEREFVQIPGEKIDKIKLSQLVNGEGETVQLATEEFVNTKLAESGSVSYLSAKRELGEDIATEEMPEVYSEEKRLLPTLLSYNEYGWKLTNNAHYGEHHEWKAFDKDESTYWYLNNKNGIIISAPYYIKITKIKIKGANVTGRQPNGFTLYGIKDSGEEVSLINKKNENTSTEKIYNIENNNIFKKYKFTARRGTNYYNVNIEELDFFGQVLFQKQIISGPKAYFLGKGSTKEIVEKTKNSEIGKIKNEYYFFVKNNDTKHIDNIKFNIEKVGNPTGNIKLNTFYLYEYDSSIVHNYTNSSSGETTLITLNNVLNTLSFDYNCPNNSYYYRVYDKDSGEKLLEFRTNPNNGSKKIEFEGFKNIDIRFYSSYNSSQEHSIFNIVCAQKVEKAKSFSLEEGENNISLDDVSTISISTTDTSSNNFWNVGKSSDGYLAGEYKIGYESGKKYASKPNIPSRSKVDGLEITGGNRGDTTIGIEGGIYEFSSGFFDFDGELYVQEDGTIGNNPTNLYLGVGYGNKIKLFDIKKGKIKEEENKNAGTTYTAESDGIIVAGYTGNERGSIKGMVNGAFVVGSNGNASGREPNQGITFVVRKGYTYQVVSDGYISISSYKFYPISF